MEDLKMPGGRFSLEAWAGPATPGRRRRQRREGEGGGGKREKGGGGEGSKGERGGRREEEGGERAMEELKMPGESWKSGRSL